MTKRELIEILDTYPDDLPIVLPGEGHGDGVNELNSVGIVKIFRNVNDFYYGKHEMTFDENGAEDAIYLSASEE